MGIHPTSMTKGQKNYFQQKESNLFETAYETVSLSSGLNSAEGFVMGVVPSLFIGKYFFSVGVVYIFARL